MWHYFNKDGSYGERTTDTADFNMAVPTSSWNQDMWELIIDWADEHRFELAKHFSMNVHHLVKGNCSNCGLDAEQLNGQHIVGNIPVVEEDTWVSLSQESYLGGAHPNSW